MGRKLAAWSLAAALAASPGTAAAAAGAAGGDERAPSRCGNGVPPNEALGVVALPHGELFCPLLADPKAIRSFASLQVGEFPRSTATRQIGSVGVGDGFGLVRRGGPVPGDGVQLALQAAVFAQFDLETRSADLLNADYLVGLPLTFRRGALSGRARLYHQSSHLGDELLLRPGVEVRNQDLTFEALELLLAGEAGPLRLYAGGEYLFHRNPAALDAALAHGGAELRPGLHGAVRPVAAVDVKVSEQQEWRPAVSVRAGVELVPHRGRQIPPRAFDVLLELYDGPSPYGQFVLESVRFAGIGLHAQL